MRSFVSCSSEHSVRFNRDKLQLNVPQVRYLGHVVSSNGILTLTRSRPSAAWPPSDISSMSPPSDKKALMRFLGMITYLSFRIFDLTVNR